MTRFLKGTTPWLLCAAALAATAQAQPPMNNQNTSKVIPGQVIVNDATGVIQQMKQDATLAGMIDHSKAVLIVPSYGANASQLANQAASENHGGNTSRESERLSSHGSPGVFMVHSTGWNGPAFFSVSDLGVSSSSGQTDEHGIPVVMMFMNTHAVDQMKAVNNISLSGLTVAHYSDHPSRSPLGKDVVFWTPPEATPQGDLAAAHLHFDSTASNAYYMNQATLSDILESNVSTQRAVNLQAALSTRVASK